MAKRIIRLTESDLSKLIKRIVEQTTYDPNFSLDEIKALRQRGFQDAGPIPNKFLLTKNGHKYEVTKFIVGKKSGWILKKDGKVLWEKFHDACGTALDDEIWSDFRTGIRK